VEEPFERSNAARALKNDLAFKRLVAAFKEIRHQLKEKKISFTEIEEVISFC